MTTTNSSNEQTIFEQIPFAVVALDAKAMCEMEATTDPLILLSNLHIPFVLMITQHDDDMMIFGCVVFFHHFE